MIIQNPPLCAVNFRRLLELQELAGRTAHNGEQSIIDLVDKRAVYAREGISYEWFVDPDARSLEAFELRGAEWVLIDTLFDDASVSLPPFEAINFNLGDLWPPQAVHKVPPQEESSKTTVESEPESISPSN